MHHFNYVDGVLHAEGVSVETLARDVGTPFYCYANATLERHYRVMADALRTQIDGVPAMICYAIKANSNQAVIATLGRLGAGMDVVSQGELMRASAAGIPGDRIIFAGIGKTRSEMAHALETDILAFNVESGAELEALSQVAATLGKTARIALRINPDVDPKTHRKISTGKAENKFGIPFGEALALYAHASTLPGIAITGVHMHIGSQITELAPFAQAFALMRDLARSLIDKGHRLSHLDLGGGLGVPYRTSDAPPPSPQDYARVVNTALGGFARDAKLKLAFEPGRLLVGNAGILVTRVLSMKRGANKTFAIVDAAMNDLIRPTLYEAYHEIWPINEPRDSEGQPMPMTRMDVVGPVCETGDYLAQDRDLAQLAADDLVAVMTAGAYGAVQAGTYNSRLLVPEVMVRGTRWAIVRPRQTYQELIGLDQLPPWLDDAATGLIKT